MNQKIVMVQSECYSDLVLKIESTRQDKEMWDYEIQQINYFNMETFSCAAIILFKRL